MKNTKYTANEALNFCANVLETVKNASAMAGFNAIDQRAASRFFLFYKDEAGNDIENAKGETLCVEVLKCENTGGPSSLPAMWYKNGWTPTELKTWWSIDVAVCDVRGHCWMRYNPQQIGQGTNKINFDWMKEATAENLTEILSEVLKRFNA